jgi:hypothetical protein
MGPSDQAPSAPQAANTGTADDQALAALVYGWGDAYLIGFDGQRGWWAARRDQIGACLTAQDPDGLWEAIRENYDHKPVPRDLTAGAEP